MKFIIIRKILNRLILTRQISKWEKNRAYPIRYKSFDLPPISVNPAPDTAFFIVSATGYTQDAAWTAQSFLRRLSRSIGLTIVVDGEIPAGIEEKFQRSFPGVVVSNAEAINQKARALCPNVAAAGEKHPLARKLAAILVMQHEMNILYSDSDILCFNPIPELEEAIRNHNTPFYMLDSNDSMTQEMLAKAWELGYGHVENLNSGLLYLPKQSLNISLAENLLQDFDFEKCDPATWWWIEQTIIAILMKENKGQALPSAKYVVSTARQWYYQKDVDYNEIAVRHFTSSVRQLMFMKGMPKIQKKINANPADSRNEN